eukprot:sb/3472702/
MVRGKTVRAWEKRKSFHYQNNCCYLEPTKTSKIPIRTGYSGHVTGYQPTRDQYFSIRSVPGRYLNIEELYELNYELTRNRPKQVNIIRTRYLGHVTGYQPIRVPRTYSISVSGVPCSLPAVMVDVIESVRRVGAGLLPWSRVPVSEYLWEGKRGWGRGDQSL